MSKYDVFMSKMELVDFDSMMELFNKIVDENGFDAFVCENFEFNNKCREKFWNDFRWFALCCEGENEFDVDSPFILFDGNFESRFESYYSESDFMDAMKSYLWRIASRFSDIYDELIK